MVDRSRTRPVRERLMTRNFAGRTGAARRRVMAAGFTLAGAVLLVIIVPALIVGGARSLFDSWLILATGVGFFGCGVNLLRRR